MQLQNFTAAPAILWRSIIDEDRMAAAVVARVTYAIVDGQLVVDPSFAWPIDKTEYESPIGPLPAEDCFRRGGVDLIVLGCARAPWGRPTSRVEVRATVGDFTGGVDVFGDRAWTRGARHLQPSWPEPFVEKPLTLANAFGGEQLWDGLPVPFVSNPEGKGYYTEERSAHGRPLPNIEDPARPIARWEDHPDPVGVGFCPRQFGPRGTRNVTLGADGAVSRIDPKFFNDAFPDLIAPPPAPGARCVFHGVREDGPLAFFLPAPPLSAHVCIGDKVVDRMLAIDQIGVEPDLGRVFITYRYPFRYTVVRMQLRACDLHWSKQERET